MKGTGRHSAFFLFGIDKGVMLFHRPVGSDATRLLVSASRDGARFSPKNITADFSGTAKNGRIFGNASSFRAGTLGTGLILSFFDRDEDALTVLRSETGSEWEPVAKRRNHGHPTVFIDTDSDPGHAVAAFASGGRKFITLSLTDASLRNWHSRGVVLDARPRSFDASALAPLSAIRTRQGIVLVYTARNREGHLTIGAALFDAKRPEILLWRSVSPIWTAPEVWNGDAVSVLGGASIGKYYYAYFRRGDAIEAFPMSRLWEASAAFVASKKPAKDGVRKLSKAEQLPSKAIAVSVSHRLSRHTKNPILGPIHENSWEAFSAFNAAALLVGGRIHLLYRAQGHDGISVLGHATTEDGSHITTRSPDPVFVPSNPFDTRTAGSTAIAYPYVSGGGWGGCEDPRLTRIGDRIYMTYIAFNGSAPPGVALTSIRTRDFGKRWDWTPPRLISRPGQIQKNWVVFPEKIRGKFAVMHNISPTIRIEYLDSLDDDGLVIDSEKPRPKPEDRDRWDNIVRGVGAPPIRTEYGWLVLYHAMDSRDPDRYKVGAMLLDSDTPETVIARSPDPILEPEADYENHGHKTGVVYVCGAVVKDGTLFVYYGASDKTLAVATADLHRFVSSLRKAKPPKLETIHIS